MGWPPTTKNYPAQMSIVLRLRKLALNKLLEVRSMSCLMLCLKAYVLGAGRQEVLKYSRGGLKRKETVSAQEDTAESGKRDHVRTGFPPH